MKRILIIGSPGSGKSTVGRALAHKLNIPLYHLDAFRWKDVWEDVSHEDFIAKQHELVAHNEWIIDGTFNKSLALRLMHADTVIYLDIPRLQCIWQIFKRELKFWRKNRPDVPNNCISYFNKGFFRLIRYTWHYKQKQELTVKNELHQLPNTIKFYQLRSNCAIQTFLKDI